MTTKSVIVVKKDGEIKIAHPRWADGYPSEEGVDILKFLLKDLKKDKFIQKLNILRFTENESEESERDQRQEKYSGSKILKYLQNSKDNIVFDSLNGTVVPSCFEFGYLIDFDKNTYEIYAQYLYSNKNSKTKKSSEFQTFNLLRKYDLNNLPSIKDLKDTFDFA